MIKHIKTIFEPYGNEWKKEMMKFTKEALIEKLKKEYIKNNRLEGGYLGNPEKSDAAAEFVMENTKCTDSK